MENKQEVSEAFLEALLEAYKPEPFAALLLKLREEAQSATIRYSNAAGEDAHLRTDPAYRKLVFHAVALDAMYMAYSNGFRSAPEGCELEERQAAGRQALQGMVNILKKWVESGKKAKIKFSENDRYALDEALRNESNGVDAIINYRRHIATHESLSARRTVLKYLAGTTLGLGATALGAGIADRYIPTPEAATPEKTAELKELVDNNRKRLESMESGNKSPMETYAELQKSARRQEALTTPNLPRTKTLLRTMAGLHGGAAAFTGLLTWLVNRAAKSDPATMKEIEGNLTSVSKAMGELLQQDALASGLGQTATRE
jgi:hypothetical protein